MSWAAAHGRTPRRVAQLCVKPLISRPAERPSRLPRRALAPRHSRCSDGPRSPGHHPPQVQPGDEPKAPPPWNPPPCTPSRPSPPGTRPASPRPSQPARTARQPALAERKLDPLAPPRPTLPAALERVELLHARYRAGEMHVHLPPRFSDPRAVARRARGHRPPRQPGRARRRLRRPLLLAAGRLRPGRERGAVPGHRRPRPGGEPYRFLDLGRPHRLPALRRERPGAGGQRARWPALRRLALRALRVPDRPVPPPQGRAPPHRARRDAALLRRQHRRGGGRERHQGGPPQPREDQRARAGPGRGPGRGREAGLLHHLLRGRLPRPDPGEPGGHPPQEGAPGLPHLRLAARPLPGRGPALRLAHPAARREDAGAGLEPARHRRRVRRAPAARAVPPPARRLRRAPGVASPTIARPGRPGSSGSWRTSGRRSIRPCSGGRSASPACWSSRCRARAASGSPPPASSGGCGCSPGSTTYR